MATVNLGRIKPVFRGAYNNSTAYVIDDIVTSGNETFIAIAATQGNATTDASKWTKLAAKGADGSDGTDVAATLQNKEIAFKTNAGALDGIPIGTAGQFLKVNSGATGYEYAAVTSKILGTSFITYQTRFTPPNSPSSGSGYSNTAFLFPQNTFQYTKTIQNSHLTGWLVISGMDGGPSNHGRGTLSFSTDGSTLESKQTIATYTTNSVIQAPNHVNAMFKVANNVAAGTITIQTRYGGNGNRFFDLINPNNNDHAEYDVHAHSHMFIMEVAN